MTDIKDWITTQRTRWRARGLPIDYLIFVGGGGIGMGINIGLTYLLTEFAHLWYLASFVLGIASNWLWNFFFHHHVTFGDRGDRRPLASSAGRFVTVNLSLTALGLGLVYLLTDGVGLPYLVSATVVVVGFSIVNFLVSRAIIF